MHVRTCCQAGRANQTDHLVRTDGLPRSHPELGEVAVEDAGVGIKNDDDVVAGPLRVHTEPGCSCSRGMDLRSGWRREVNARVYVEPRTKWIERLKLKRRASERLAHMLAHHYCFDGQPHLAGHGARDNQPDQEGARQHSHDPHQAGQAMNPDSGSCHRIGDVLESLVNR